MNPQKPPSNTSPQQATPTFCSRITGVQRPRGFWFNTLRKAGIEDVKVCCGTFPDQDYDHVRIRVNGFDVETTYLYNFFYAGIGARLKFV